jgi:hypothetical protein
MSNRLAGATSPYLVQHAENPSTGLARLGFRAGREPKTGGARVGSVPTPVRRPAPPLAEGDRRSPMGPTTMQMTLPADRS